jgi:hypothetical protein
MCFLNDSECAKKEYLKDRKPFKSKRLALVRSPFGLKRGEYC